MAIKKSELYSSLWASCDELRGGMDASQYKDYVLAMLFIKYVSDKYSGQPFAPIIIPQGASFKDMVKLKGKANIGEKINTDIVAPLMKASELSDMPDFNDDVKLGTGKEKVDRLTNLISIFENKNLDFSNNRADDDDILGDAYEYLMRHFATESGKSKGQFYTPAEVSRVMAQIIGIHNAHTRNDTTVYDPTCGSGSLLLKVGEQADSKVTQYGQEKDSSTAGLARMNMILHDNAQAEIKQGNTLSNPMFKEGDTLKTFDYVVANPPFSDKRWSTGLDPKNDPYHRFSDYGEPPAKQGDYAYLLHIVRSLKTSGKGACILPHGVLFRGNAEAEIRRNLVKKGIIKGIVGLPANLFYGTGIAACIIVLDKENATERNGIFMIDASNGFLKDGNKNRLRDMDIHRIVDVFNKQTEEKHFSKMVTFDEIEKNEYNLNIPRYIESRQTEEIQDIDAHLNGGIPQGDVDAMELYWDICPHLKDALFSPLRDGYLSLNVAKDEVKNTIYKHSEFTAFTDGMNTVFEEWKARQTTALKTINRETRPKIMIKSLAEDLLRHYGDKKLIDEYDIYQHIMDYWMNTMQDDVYMIVDDGWKAETYRITELNKNKKEVDKGWACDLIPKELLVKRYFQTDMDEINDTQAEIDAQVARTTEIEEGEDSEDGAFAGMDNINKTNVSARIKELKTDGNSEDELKPLSEWMETYEKIAMLKKTLKASENALDKKAYDKYNDLTEDDVKTIVVDEKWFSTLAMSIHGEMERVSQTLSTRVKELADRYAHTIGELSQKSDEIEAKVQTHLETMGFSWK